MGAGVLSERRPAHLCAFSPCIEQVQRRVQELRALGWLEVEMVEIAARRLEVRRERVNGQDGTAKGQPAAPTSVEEAVERLRQMEQKAKLAHGNNGKGSGGAKKAEQQQQHLKEGGEGAVEGPLVHRSEPELKAHTSYLTFAVRPVQ